MKTEYQNLIKDGWTMVQYRTERHYHPPGKNFIQDIIKMNNENDHFCFTVTKYNLDNFLEEYENE